MFGKSGVGEPGWGGSPGGRAATMRTQRMLMAGFAAGTLLLVPACDDEDGDGGTTDEEIQDLEDTGEDVQDQVEEEIDSQDEGTNEDGE